MSQLTFYYDFSSPFAYLGATQVEAVAERHGARLVLQSFLLGALFRTIGTPMVPFNEMPVSKQRHAKADMYRWAEHYDVAFEFPTRFPMNTVKALRMNLQLNGAAASQFMHAVYRAYWADDRDIDDGAVLTALADNLGLDGAELLAGCQDPAVKLRLREATDAAVAAGLCGAPSYLVLGEDDDEPLLFWGQDRLPLIERALDGWRPRSG
jgi:2-hydroxychromene-2-carboxylate isomerase